ncbi:Transcriptional regulator PadR family protein [Candidatus Sulfotelmatobacter kueseliae]|jgi:DNA-binding PadR family transcriptional regulator|uniref:Transcriptional regulator PadR family protein n=1 Tax=Candidatus Sulfotelmatobacter kueseliae TaxID=2042962 RepID=A0A2U3KPU9_9BACT|nr:Transcriptional regulator PadR family protein [Candidatus Sulfotelmatobacter kueseliae]
MPVTTSNIPDDLQHLFPLTPAVFFILFALAEGEKHGYAIMQQVSILSDGKFRMGPGTLYTTIQRLLELSLIEEIDADSGSRRRYYRLTRTGKLVFKAEVGRMDAVVKLALQHRRVLHEGA